jgi:dipeptidyl aminopeptidase/acylaminoacyl peptidase
MKWGVALLVTAGLWLGSANVLADVKAPPAVEAFGRVPAIDGVALSPSGRWVAWIDNSGAAAMIEVFDLEKRATLKRVNAPADLKLRGLDWADDEILLIHGSLSKALTQQALKAPVLEWFRTVAMEVQTGKARILLHRSDALNFVTGASLLALHTSKPKTVMMSSWGFSAVNYRTETGSRLTGGRKDDGWTHNLYEVDTLSGEGRLVDAGTPFTVEWLLDANGAAAARGEWDAQQSKYTIMHRRGGGWSEVFSRELDSPPNLRGMARDGSAVLMSASLDQQHIGLWRVPVDGSAPQLALGDDAKELLSVISDPYSRDVLGAWIGGLTPELRWIDEQAGKRAKALQKTFGGKQVVTIGRSVDNSRALLSVGSHASPSVYYLVDFKRGAADIVGEEYPALVDVPLGEVRDLTYKARDGYEVPAFLTLPPAAKAEKLPLVVLPHGGPESRDNKSFDFVAQFLASRGYAVLQPQFRGSTGFGVAHRKAGYRQWGKLMQDDVTDGVRSMIDQGIADPKRVCIAGMSYGGYAALAGAAFTPELYACAISVNGVSDLPNMLGYERRVGGAESDSVAYWKEHIGPANSPDVIGKSPARAARNVRAPVLLMHGIDDSIVPIAQSQGMMRALGGVPPHELIELPGEDHWLSRSATRIRVLTEMERFLAKHLPMAGQAGD